MIGNAVPVNLAFFVASTILKYINQDTVKEKTPVLFNCEKNLTL
jgi:hypothetical protein